AYVSDRKRIINAFGTQGVRGHNGDIGNEKADANAKLGSGQNNDKPVMVSVKGEEINKLKKQVVNPLILESRL
ncbi:hypothetical protein ACLBO7_30925, partial [Klebsiella pneumoniae]